MKKDNQNNLAESFTENLIKASQDFYANTEFFDKSKCFSKNFIAETINSGNLPDESILNHLFDCADCFQNYRNELVKHKEKTAQEKSFVFFAPFLRWQFAVFLLAGICLLSLIWFYYSTEKSNEIAQIQTQNDNLSNIKQITVESNENINSNENVIVNQNKETVKSVSITKEKTEKSLPKIVSNEKNAVKKITETVAKDSSENVNLELTESSVLRSDNYFNQSNSYKLPAKKINLQLKLPNLYENGNYKIKLIDAKTKTLLSNNSILQNSTISIKNLDLQKFKNKATRICLQKNGEIPDCFNIQIQ